MTPEEFADQIAGHHNLATAAQYGLYPVLRAALGAGQEVEHHRQATPLWLACARYWKQPDSLQHRRAVIEAVRPLLPTPPADEGTDE